MCSPSVVESLHNIIILAGAFHPAPEIILLKLVLMAEFEHTRLQCDDLLGGERLSYPVGVLEFGWYFGDVHDLYYQLQKNSV